MARVLFISYDGMTDPLGQSQVLPYLIGLSKKGYQISLLSCEKPERAFLKDTIIKLCKQHHIDWHPIAYTKKPPILSTLKDVSALRKKAAVLHQQQPYQLVHCRSYIAALVGQWLKKKYGLPYIFDMRGFWANERVDGGLWNTQKRIYRKIYQFFKKKEQQFLIGADAVVSLTYCAQEEISTWGIPHAPITVIPCCVDTQLFDPEALNKDKLLQLKRKVALGQNKLVLGYVGSLGTWYLLKEMLEFFKIWLSQFPDAVFFFVTNEPKEMILKAAQQLRIDTHKIVVVNAQRSEVPYYIAMMDFGIFFIKNAYSKKASSPVKQGEMMAMGLPLICNAGVGDTDYIVQKYHSGVLVPSFDTTAYNAAITTLRNSLQHPNEIRKGAIDYFDLEKGIQSYANLYQSLLSGLQSQ